MGNDLRVYSRFVWGEGAVPEFLVLLDRSGNVARTLRYATDERSSPVALIDAATGYLFASYRYDPWGRVTSQPSVPGIYQPFGFAGCHYDELTELCRFGARDYDARTGRWTAKDPILFDGGTTNLYEYCNNDPVNCTDRSGMAFLYFDRQKGELYVDPEIEGRKPYTLKSTSGRDECMNDPSSQNEKDRGVIPGGFYTADVGEISDPSPLGDVKRFLSPLADMKLKTADWGDWRVPLKPQRQLNDALGFDFPGNRNNFFLHGGIRPGSAGCIDFGGGLFGNKDTNRLLNDLRSDPDGTIWLFVK